MATGPSKHSEEIGDLVKIVMLCELFIVVTYWSC